MKRLHLLMLRSFWGPLTINFILVFTFQFMLFVWKYVDDMMGKGLEWTVLAELLLYACATFVPLSFPLAILLGSMMTMGALGENSELVPLRSAGLGLFRIIYPIGVVVVLLAGVSFWFSNNVIPVANLKFYSRLWDVTQKKPALNLQPGVFYNGITGVSIRVREKNEDGSLKDILIHDHRDQFQGNRTVIRAATGRMQRSTDGRYLLLSMDDGVLYDERGTLGTEKPRKGVARADHPLLRGRFDHDMLRLDLSGLDFKRVNEDLYKDQYKMLTLGQLEVAIDSLRGNARERILAQEKYLRSGSWAVRDSARSDGNGVYADRKAFLGRIGKDQQQGLAEKAMDLARNQISFIERGLGERHQAKEQLARYGIEWHRKLMLAMACIIFFFIGAPLGAIVRKGGLGLPVVFAALFFIAFHIISYSTEQMVKGLDMSPWPGMWISTLAVFPVGLFLTYKAATDSPLLDSDAYHRAWEKLRRKGSPGPRPDRDETHADPAVVQ